MTQLERQVKALEQQMQEMRVRLMVLMGAVQDDPSQDGFAYDISPDECIGDGADINHEGDIGGPTTNNYPRTGGGDGGKGYWFKGPLEMYDVNAPAGTVKFYGCGAGKRLVAEAAYHARFKGIKHPIGNGTAPLDTAIAIATGTRFYVKGLMDTTGNPDYGMVYTFEQTTEAVGFPQGEQTEDYTIEIIPCWYVNVVTVEGVVLVDYKSVERWLAQVNIPGIS
jgi:hypothetical protein